MPKARMQTIYGVTRVAGLAASTVGRVLNGREGIGEGTRLRVMEATGGNGKRRAKSRAAKIAVVADRASLASSSGFLPAQLTLLLETISQRNGLAELITSESLDRVHDPAIEGVIILAGDEQTVLSLRQSATVPVVAINRLDVDAFSAITWDQHTQGQLAAKYLIGKGHRRLAMVCEERQSWGSAQRIRGFSESLQEAGLVPNDCCIASTDHQPIYGVLSRLIGDCKPTALFIAGEDLLLEAAFILTRMLNLRIPADVSVVGIESARVSQFMSPPMTSLAQSMPELAKAAVDMVMSQIAEGRSEIRQVILPTGMIERESVAAPGGEHRRARSR